MHNRIMNVVKLVNVVVPVLDVKHGIIVDAIYQVDGIHTFMQRENT
ncbi:MAG: hypothetical protein Q4D51_06440 [Eubacteriales bacterium]|nr:hypothetical protein [Eubacteriales bacterium]